MSSSASTITLTKTCEDADTHESSSDDRDQSGIEGDEGDVEDVDSGDEMGDDNSLDSVLSKIKIPPSVRPKAIVTVPKLIVHDKLTFDCPYLVSCHVLSSILSPTRIIGLTSP